MNRCFLAIFVLVVATTARADGPPLAIDGYEAAFNARDESALASFWAVDAIYIDHSSDQTLTGREAILGQLRESFTQSPSLRLKVIVDESSSVDATTRTITGTTELTDADGPTESFGFEATVQSADGKWHIVRLEEFAAGDAVDPLAGLRWLEGVWQSDGEADAAIHRVEALPGDRFWVRTFDGTSDPALSGRQVIGVLPGDDQIQSWTYLGDGTVGRERWTIESEVIRISTTQRLPDGVLATGTYVITPVDETTLTVKLVGHTIGGEPQPSASPVTMKRLPNPADDAPTPETTR